MLLHRIAWVFTARQYDDSHNLMRNPWLIYSWRVVRFTSHIPSINIVKSLPIISCIIWLFGYCKGGTSWMRNLDWPTLDIGKNWKWGVVLFKSNCIILRHYLIYSLKRQQNNCIWNCLSNISIKANIVDPDQTAAWSRSTLFFYEASNILVDDKNHTFYVYAL